MKEIGGYFGLELSGGSNRYHSTPYRFKSGRSSLNFLLHKVRPAHVYLPFYTCNALLEPFIINEVPYTFYSINQDFEIAVPPLLKERELLIYVNYYDIKRDYVEKLSSQYEDKLVVDCTQSYFLKGNNKSWYFNSTRKHFGVPDGSDLYVPSRYDFLDEYEKLKINTNYLVDHLLLRFNGEVQKGYDYFKKNELLSNCSQHKMSKLASSLLSHTDFEKVMTTRRDNFNYLHKKLGQLNSICIKAEENISAFYPFLPDVFINKPFFWSNNVFVPIFWQDCVNRPNEQDFELERKISKCLLPLPVDHRYSLNDMETIVALCKSFTNGNKR